MSNYVPLDRRKQSYEEDITSGSVERIPLHQYVYRLKGSEPWRLTSSWYNTRAHATDCLRRIYGDHLVADSVKPVDHTAAHVPPWRRWGAKTDRYVDHVGGDVTGDAINDNE